MQNFAAVAQQIAYIVGDRHPHHYITTAVQKIERYRQINPDLTYIQDQMVKEYGKPSKVAKRNFIEAAVKRLTS